MVSERCARPSSLRRLQSPQVRGPRRRDVAQFGSAPALGAGGRGFKSRRPDRRSTLVSGLPPDRLRAFRWSRATSVPHASRRWISLHGWQRHARRLPHALRVTPSRLTLAVPATRSAVVPGAQWLPCHCIDRRVRRTRILASWSGFLPHSSTEVNKRYVRYHHDPDQSLLGYRDKPAAGPVGTPKFGSTKVASRTEGLRPCGWRRARAIDQACAALSRGWPPGGFILALEVSRRSVRRCTSTSNRASPRFSTRVVAEASRQETAPPTSAMAATIPATATGRAARTTRDMPPVCGTRRLPRSAASHTTITRRGRILCCPTASRGSQRKLWVIEGTPCPPSSARLGPQSQGRPRFPDSIVEKVAAHLCGLEG